MRSKGGVVWDERLESVSLERNVIFRLFDVFIQELLRYHEHKASAAVGNRNELDSAMASLKYLFWSINGGESMRSMEVTLRWVFLKYFLDLKATSYVALRNMPTPRLPPAQLNSW